jgi:hypothetical protein
MGPLTLLVEHFEILVCLFRAFEAFLGGLLFCGWGLDKMVGVPFFASAPVGEFDMNLKAQIGQWIEPEFGQRSCRSP